MSELLLRQARTDFNRLLEREGVSILVIPQKTELKPINSKCFFVPNALESPAASYNRKLTGKHHEVTLAVDLMKGYQPVNEDQVTVDEHTYTVNGVEYPEEMKIVLAVR